MHLGNSSVDILNKIAWIKLTAFNKFALHYITRVFIGIEQEVVSAKTNSCSCMCVLNVDDAQFNS